MLKVKKLRPNAILPQVAHPGEDLGYDVFALEDATLAPGKVTKVRTGVAVEAYRGTDIGPYSLPLGLLIRDRSSMAARGITVSGGVIDAGYRGEIVVLLTNQNVKQHYGTTTIKAGDKIAQMIPVEILTGDVMEVTELTEASRGEAGFGSTGQ